MKSLRIKIIWLNFIFLILSEIVVQGQIYDCGTTHLPGSNSRSSTCDVNLSQIPVKTIRITFHVFLKDDGTGNIPNNQAGTNYLWLMNKHSSDVLGAMASMIQPTYSPHIVDTKIRTVVVGYRFWNNTSMWSKGERNQANLNALYNFVMSQNFPYKHNSTHVLIPGNYTPAPSLGGIACDIGCMTHMHLRNVYMYYGQNNFWAPGNVMRHELGHCLDLFHSWSNDLCDDTPAHGISTWSTLTNNIMDYNPTNNSITLDQVSRCHSWLSQHQQYLTTGAQTGSLAISLTNSGNNGPQVGSTINTYSSSATVLVSAPGVQNFSWTYLGGSGGSYTSSSNGALLNLFGLGSISLKVTWMENCMTFSRSLTFYNAGYYFSVGPSPTYGQVNLEINPNKTISALNEDDKVIYFDIDIREMAIFDSFGNLTDRHRVLSNYNSYDISHYRDGVYRIVLLGDNKFPIMLESKIVKVR